MNKWKFCVVFAAGVAAGAFCMIALQTSLGRSGRPGGEILVLPMVVLLLWAGWCLGRSRDTFPMMGVAETDTDAEEYVKENLPGYWSGYSDGYDDALETMEFSKPVRNRPEKKRRRKDRKAVPERRKGA